VKSEAMIAVFQRPKTVCALERMTIVIGVC
jgi:hypothetical protein